jgi:hypothetical protein
VRTHAEKIRRRNTSVSIVTITFTFILCTLPNAIAGGYYISILFQSEIGTIILFITDCFAFTFHSFNFAVFFIMNKKFSSECRLFLKRLKLRNNKTYPKISVTPPNPNDPNRTGTYQNS